MGSLRSRSEWEEYGERVAKLTTDVDKMSVAVLSHEVDKLSAADGQTEAQRVRAVAHIRRVLFESLYPLPHSFKKLAWAVLVLWALAACITAIVYGLSFDIEYSSTEKESAEAAEPCWDAPLINQIE